jgi:hypothetical protein
VGLGDNSMGEHYLFITEIENGLGNKENKNLETKEKRF